MKAALLFPVPVCIFACSIALDAQIFDGEIEYAVYNKAGNKKVQINESYQLIRDDEGIFITIKRSQSSLQVVPPEVTWPEFQEISFIDDSTYYLKKWASETNMFTAAIIDDGNSIPLLKYSPSVTLLWFAFASSEILKETTDRTRLFWSPDAEGNKQFSEDYYGTLVIASSINDGRRWVEGVAVISDGRLDPFNLDRSPVNLAPSPFNIGFTQAVFRVNTFTNRANVGYFPQSFQLTTFAFDSSDQGIPKQRVFGTVTGDVRRVSINGNFKVRLPHLDGTKVAVRDLRFQNLVSNWGSVSYVISNRWLSNDSKDLSNVVSVHMTSAPASGSQLSAERTMFLVALLALTMIPLVVMACKNWFLTTVNKQTNTTHEN